MEIPLNEIAERIVREFHPARIVLFGSRARGDAGPDSDVDLLVEMESDLSPRARAVRVDALFSNRLWPMDVLVITPQEAARQRLVRNSLISAAEREGKVLYEQRG
jgi:predicted nucleotidyltransferase